MFVIRSNNRVMLKQISKVGGLDLSRRPKKSRQFQKVSLDDQDIEIEKSRFCLDTSEKSEKSRSRPRNLDFVSTRPKSPKSLD